MNTAQVYADLLDHLKQTIALSQVGGIISWDQQTMMPKEGGEARAEQSAALAGVIHQRNADPRIEDWCETLDLSQLNDEERANVREATRSHRRATRLPAKLVEEMARHTALGQGIWARARASEDVSAFLPTLETIIAMKRQEAECLRDGECEIYDVLLDDFEPGMKTAALATLLGRLRPGLRELREKISEAGKKAKPLSGTFDESSQIEMARRLASVFNYRWEAGRMDKAVHPFTSGYRSDSRITTRVNPENVFDCLYSTIHEVGHANYEQGRDPKMDLTPAGGYASVGVHESQSRMLENQIGRSRAFMDWLYPQMSDVFSDFEVSSPDELFAVVNNVDAGFIRTEADEVHYNLHVLLRFDLEQVLVRGDLQVNDLEAAWNDRFLADFGNAIDKPSNGMLQDVHWSCGMFGYFPTYSLGNIYAGELFATMGKAISTRDDLIAQGDLQPISNWLTTNIHQPGHLYPAQQLMENVINKTPDEGALIDYLNAKFGGLYGFG